MTDDAPLWELRDWCRWLDDPDGTRWVTQAVLEHHMGFWKHWAGQHGSKRWPAERWTYLLHEVVAIAAERVPTYDPTQGAKFVSYVSPALRSAYWRVGDGPTASVMEVGVKQRRLARVVQKAERAYKDEHGVVPTNQQLSDALGQDPTAGSAVSAERVAALRRDWRPHTPPPTDDGQQLPDPLHAVADPGATPEQAALAAAVSDEVAAALRSLGLDRTGQLIVVRRLLADPPDDAAELAAQLGTSVAQVIDTEQRIAERLAEALAHLAPPGTPPRQLHLPWG